jgi:hypothetical protein
VCGPGPRRGPKLGGNIVVRVSFQTVCGSFCAIQQKTHRNWIWERNNTNTGWLAGWLAGWMAGWSRGLAGRVSRWLDVCHPRWLAGQEIGSKNWIRKLDVPISGLTFRNDVSNFRSNFPIQFFNAFHSRGVLGKIGSRNWIRKLDHRIWCLIRSNLSIQFYDPILRSNFSLQASRGAGLVDSARFSTTLRQPPTAGRPEGCRWYREAPRSDVSDFFW